MSPSRASHVNTTKPIQDKTTSRTVFHRYFKKCELSNKIGQRNAGIKTQAKLVVARESDGNCHDKISNPVGKVEPAEKGKNQLSRTSTKGTNDNLASNRSRGCCNVGSRSGCWRSASGGSFSSRSRQTHRPIRTLLRPAITCCSC